MWHQIPRLPVLLFGQALALLVAGKVGAAEVTVTVTEAGRSGMVRGALYANAESFSRRNDPVAVFGLTPVEGKTSVTFHAVAPGRYAAVAFQDVNANGQLDVGALGVPTEPFGFSNSPSVASGPPQFGDVSFEVGRGDFTITIKLGGFQ